MSAQRRRRDLGKRALRKGFELGQRGKFDLLPRHFYSEVPDIAELRRSRAWREPRDTSFIAGSELTSQVSFLETCCSPDVLGRLPADVHAAACAENGAAGYGEIEAKVLYCFVVSKRPRQIIQVGCGVSTAVILRACRDVDHDVELICVDPFPTDYLVNRAARNEIELLHTPAQVVDVARFDRLRSGDLLFVDSTHTVKPGSEVNRLILEILPRLAPGVFAHFHDVVLPFDYAPGLLGDDLFFWTESVLLHAFLTQNEKWTLRVALAMLHHLDPESMGRLAPGYRPARFDRGLLLDAAGAAHFPSAAYLQTVA